MTFTPREDFRKSPLSKGWSDVAASNQFQAAVGCAMMHYSLSLAGDQNAGHKIQGAKQFIDALMSLAESPQPQTGIPIPQLNPT